jgi:hypothetical protein
MSEMLWVVYRPELDKHVETLKGYEIDEDIYPNGGILVTKPLKHRLRRSKGGRASTWEDLTLEATAKYLAQVRSSLTWTAAPVPDEDSVPRWSKMTPTVAVASPEDEIDPDEAYRQLRVDAKAIMAVGGPPIDLRSTAAKLVQYVRENREPANAVTQ